MLKGGDHAAFAELYNRFYSLLFVHAFRRLGSDESASDLIQDIFVEFWERRSQLELRGSVSSFLYTMVRNQIIDQFTRSKVADKYVTSLGAFFDQDGYEADFKLRESQLYYFLVGPHPQNETLGVWYQLLSMHIARIYTELLALGPMMDRQVLPARCPCETSCFPNIVPSGNVCEIRLTFFYSPGPVLGVFSASVSGLIAKLTVNLVN